MQPESTRGVQPLVYRALGYRVTVEPGLLCFASDDRPTGRPSRWAIFLALLAVEAEERSGERRGLGADVLQQFQPFSESLALSTRIRVRKQIRRWEAAGLRLVDYHQVTLGWSLSDTFRVQWDGLTIGGLQALLSLPGQAEFLVDLDDFRFTRWLRACVRAMIELHLEEVQRAEHRLIDAVDSAPTPSTTAAALMLLASTRQRITAREDAGSLARLEAMSTLGGAVGRAIILFLMQARLLATHTPGQARQFLQQVDSWSRRGVDQLSAGERANLFASGALAARRCGEHSLARTLSAAAAVASVVAHDIWQLDRSLGELTLASYQDPHFRPRTNVWYEWAISSLRLEAALGVDRANRQVSLALVRELTITGRLVWARRMLEEGERALRLNPRAGDVALAAACRASLLWAERSARASKRGLRGGVASSEIIAAYLTAEKAHRAAGRDPGWFLSELEAVRRGERFRFRRS